MNPRGLFLRIRALALPRRVERELAEELAFHIERETQQHIAAGLSPIDARTRAVARFGPVPLAADQCRDARGTGVVEDLTRDIQYAFRTFRRAPLAALTVVATVALGLGLVAAVFTVYDIMFLRVDAVRSPHELFQVSQRTGPDDEAPLPLTRRDHDALRNETSVFSDTVAMLDPGMTRTGDGRVIRGALVTGNFFQVLGIRALLGRALTPADDERLAGQPVIVLSHAAWHKLFRGDRGVIGRRMVIRGAPYEIVGVMPEGFRGLDLTPPDYWSPLALAGQFRDAYAGREDEITITVVGRLKPGMSPEAATAALASWTASRSVVRSPDRPTQVLLVPRQGTIPADASVSLLFFSPLFFAFGLILLIGCANVANLLLARGVSRQREIGIRLSLGASRRRIIRQLLTESLLLALVAAACGFVACRLLLAGALAAAISTMPAELVEAVSLLNIRAPAFDWRILVFLVVGAVVSTVFFGLAPALQSTRVDLVPTMRGELRSVRQGLARQVLIAAQVGAAALLLISAGVFLRGAVAAATKDPGIRTSDTMTISIENEPRRAALLQALTAHPLVATVAATSSVARGAFEIEMPARLPVDRFAVSGDYFDVLGLHIVSGRSFTPAERSADAGVAVVSETMARRLWPNGGAVGQPLRLGASPSASTRGGPPPSRTLTVVGVVRDPGRSSGFSNLDTSRGVYLPAGPETPGTQLLLRVHGSPEHARQTLLRDLAAVDPDLNEIKTLRMLAGWQTYVLGLAASVSILLGGLAVILTVSGLFSVLSYVVEQRTQEIGLRMALGATTKNVVRLVLSQSLRPVGIGLAAGGGLAAAAATALMATPGASAIGEWVRVFDPVAYGASVLVILTACVLAVSVPTFRAARVDPIAALRED